MSQIFNDREALGLLLKDIKTEQDAKEAFEALGTVLSKGARQVGRRLPYAGALGMETMRPSVLPEATTEEDSEVGPVSSVAPTAIPTPPPVPAQPVAQPTTTLASVSPPPPPQAPSGPVDRTRYAAMFPNDPASALIRQQGIGSLMG